MSNDSSKPLKQPEKWYKLPLKVFVWGTCITVLFTIAMIIVALAAQQPECPSNYTQAMVDSSGCRIGADMGGVGAILVGGFLFFWTLIVTAVVAAIKGFMVLRNSKSSKL
ncbi:hypothetical protein EYC59_03150 [Candidatus Saccharibacteria bacterium]|nr:MAG: hypothetical protein EYC59_03150 [Candidatus Saccharibacteria bacterium]